MILERKLVESLEKFVSRAKRAVLLVLQLSFSKLSYIQTPLDTTVAK